MLQDVIAKIVAKESLPELADRVWHAFLRSIAKEPPVFMDGGRADAWMVMLGAEEIAERYVRDNSIANDPALSSFKQAFTGAAQDADSIQENLFIVMANKSADLPARSPK